MNYDTTYLRPLEEKRQEALTSLEDAERAVRFLVAISPDWTAKQMLALEFADLRRNINEFAHYQLGLRAE